MLPAVKKMRIAFIAEYLHIHILAGKALEIFNCGPLRISLDFRCEVNDRHLDDKYLQRAQGNDAFPEMPAHDEHTYPDTREICYAPKAFAPMPGYRSLKICRCKFIMDVRYKLCFIKTCKRQRGNSQCKYRTYEEHADHHAAPQVIFVLQQTHYPYSSDVCKRVIAKR